MAAYRTDGVTFNTTAGVKTVVLTSVIGDLFIVIGAESTVTTTPTLTDDQAGGTYTLITSVLKNSSADKMFVWVRDNLFRSAVSTTVTYTPVSDSGGGLDVIAISGMDKAGLAAIRQSATQANQASGTPAPAFAAPVAKWNLCIGASFSGTNGNSVVPPANWTERQDVGHNVPAAGLETCTRDLGEILTTITWGGASGSAFGALILELDSLIMTPPLMPRGQQYMRSGR